MLNSTDILLDYHQIITADAHLKEFCANEQSWIKSLQKYWEQDRIRVGVIGVTSSGKSTLVNAILGRQLLSSAVVPSSGQLVCCSHGHEEAATVRFRNGNIKKISGKKLLTGYLSKYSDERFNPGNKRQVKNIELSTPTFDLGEDVLLIDSPGLDAYGLKEHEKLTLESLVPTVDACIYVTTTKQNSDLKTKNVLDIVAKYRCPIIIVQNMLDAVMPSPSGDKTRKQVARDHKERIRRIVRQSDIKDKENVNIIQMSARLALAWRCHPETCSAKEKRCYQISRYSQFRDSVCSILARQRPAIEQKRLEMIYTRAANLQKATKEKISVPTQKLESVFPLADFREQFRGAAKAMADCSEQAFTRYMTVCEEIRMALSLAEETADGPKSASTGADAFWESVFVGASKGKAQHWDLETCVKKTNRAVDDLGRELQQLISDCNALVIGAADTVNIPSRDLLHSVSLPMQGDIHVKEKIIKKSTPVPKKGFFNRIARFAGDIFYEDWGYERKEIDKVVTDEDATKASIFKQLSTVGARYEETMQDWFGNKFDPAVQKVLQSIDEQEDTYNRQKQALVEIDCLRQMSEALTRFLERLEPECSMHTGADCAEIVLPADEPDYQKTLQIDVADYIKPLVELSRYAIRTRHRQFFRTFMEDIGCLAHKPVIIGWDDICRDKLLWQSGMTDALCLSPIGALDEFPPPGPFCLFVLVNTTQIGEARRQIDALCLRERLCAEDCVIWVVQDLQELLNGGDAGDGLLEMTRLGELMRIPCKSFFYVCHENPLYAWAFMEVQMDPSLAESPHLLISTMQEKYKVFTNRELETELGHLLPGILMFK